MTERIVFIYCLTEIFKGYANLKVVVKNEKNTIYFLVGPCLPKCSNYIFNRPSIACK